MSLRFSLLLLAGAVLQVVSPCTGWAQAPTIPAQNESPRIFIGAGAGILDVQSLIDPTTNATWDMGTTFQGRASVERAFQNSAAVGIVGAFGRGPMTYRGPACSACSANVSVWQLLAMFRIGGGRGLHQVIEVGAGLTGFTSMEGKNTEQPLPGRSFTDGTVVIGYGFGYPIGQNSTFTLVQELGILFHDAGDSPSASSSNTIRTSVTRVGLRFPFGGMNR